MIISKILISSKKFFLKFFQLIIDKIILKSFRISYKSDLKKRETINKHKQDLKELVEKNLKNKDELQKITNNKQLPSNDEDLDEDEKELIQNEIAFADTSNYISNKKKKKQQQERDKRISFRASIKNLNNESIIEPKTFVCSVCAK
jgi:DNA-binding helix-hairpin-helix protein with protein kinase domain